MRNKIYSERRRRVHSFLKSTLKDTFLGQWFYTKPRMSSIETDPLTGIYNQFGINTYLKELHPHTGTSYAIVLLNLDNFKDIQHSYGLKAAERVLVKASSILTNNIRDTDLVGKYGEHEFILILCDIDLDNANQVAQRCLDLIQSYEFRVDLASITLQASCGVSVSQTDLVSDKVLQHADQALFLAKASGLNQLRDQRAIYS